MIIVAGTVTVPADKHDDLVAVMGDLVARTRAEEGCEEYEFWADLNRGGRFHFFEVWRDEAALGAHFASPHLKAFQEARARFQGQVALRRYRAEEIRPA